MSISNQPAGQREKAAIRRQQVFELRMRGASHRAIAKQLGVGATTVGQDLRAELARLAAQTQASAEQLRTMELERLDLAMRSIARKVQEGDLQAVDRWLRLCESRRRLLGLDAQPQLLGDVDGTGAVALTFVVEQLPAAPPAPDALPAPNVEMIDVPAIVLPAPPSPDPTAPPTEPRDDVKTKDDDYGEADAVAEAV
jgi:predicted transcriptional regulator